MPAFHPISADFFIKWKEILYNAEKNLVDLLLYESSKVIAEIEIDFSNEFLNPILTITKRSILN